MDRADTDKMLEMLERSAVAQERLIELATEERYTNELVEALGPAVCPHCGTFNPRVRSEGGDGDMKDFVLVALCMAERCAKTFYAFPQGWTVLRTQDEAREEMEKRNGST